VAASSEVMAEVFELRAPPPTPPTSTHVALGSGLISHSGLKLSERPTADLEASPALTRPARARADPKESLPAGEGCSRDADQALRVARCSATETCTTESNDRARHGIERRRLRALLQLRADSRRGNARSCERHARASGILDIIRRRDPSPRSSATSASRWPPRAGGTRRLEAGEGCDSRNELGMTSRDEAADGEGLRDHHRAFVVKPLRTRRLVGDLAVKGKVQHIAVAGRAPARAGLSLTSRRAGRRDADRE